jgi:alkylhydroperoxidase family enzyme
MPRLREVRRAEVSSPQVLAAYDKHFGQRDPVTEPGAAGGAPGNWWTVFALEPGLFQLMLQRHEWQSSTRRVIDPLLRELALTRTGWAAGSVFVFSQHCKALRRLGVNEERIAGIPSWSSESCYSDAERAVLGYTDDLVACGGRVPDQRFAALKNALPDVAILELSFMICTYIQSSIMCRALQLEFDEHPDLVVEQPDLNWPTANAASPRVETDV